MSEMNDPELEALLAELAPSDEERVTLLEEHRQLEKDLLRLADPRVVRAMAKPTTTSTKDIARI